MGEGALTQRGAGPHAFQQNPMQQRINTMQISIAGTLVLLDLSTQGILNGRVDCKVCEYGVQHLAASVDIREEDLAESRQELH